MGLVILKGRNGQDRPSWYGEYVEEGKRRLLNLNVPIVGGRPASLRDVGDAAFERSRGQAEKELSTFLKELRAKGRAEHLTERLIESKTGKAVQYTQIDMLSERWRKLGRETAASEAHLANCDAAFARFTEFIKQANPAAAHLYEVSAENAAQFVQTLQAVFARKTVRDNVKLLNKAFERFLPVGAVNPFAGMVGRRAAGESETVHRKPFSPEELQAILREAEGDSFMYPLIVTAACTGMRRGDVCGLDWSNVDLTAGMISVKTSKTGATVEIPVFAPLLEALKRVGAQKRGLVFPEAAAMLTKNPDGLTWRFKKIVARALEDKAIGEDVPHPASEIEAEGLSAIETGIVDDLRKRRMLDLFTRYCGGASLRQIVEATGYCKATVSNDLHKIESLIGKRFLRVQTKSVKSSVRDLTQEHRTKGQRAASVRDWHALRATWVTLALSAGVPVELVRRVTGHATVEVVLKHYFRPDREQFKAALTGALPEVLTGKAENQKPKVELAKGRGNRKAASGKDELVALAGKVAAGTATKAEMSRFKKLAAGM